MIDVSQNYKDIYNSGEWNAEVKLDVYSQDGATFVHSFGMNRLISINTSRGLLSHDGLSVGNTVIGNINVVLYPTDSHDDPVDIPKNATLIPSIRLVPKARGMSPSEWIQKGVFNIDSRGYDSMSGKMTLYGYDPMRKAEQTYGGWIGRSTAFNVLVTIANIIGVTVDDRTWDCVDRNFVLGLSPSGSIYANYSELSCRYILGALAGVYFANAIITDDGKLLILPLSGFVESDPGSGSRHNLGNLQYAKEVFLYDTERISGVNAVYNALGEEQKASFGSDTYQVLDVTCAPAQLEDNTFPSLLTSYSTWRYNPYVATGAFVNPAAELGDAITVSGKSTLIYRQDIDFGVLMRSTIEAPHSDNSEYDYIVRNAATNGMYVPKEDRDMIARPTWDDVDDMVKQTVIPFGVVDSTSTSTNFTASVDGVKTLRNGVCCYLTNGVVTSASGWTLNVNNLGAKPVYGTMAAATRSTTVFNINYTMLFVYNENRVEDGCWDVYYGYYSDKDTLAYNIRRGNGSYIAATAMPKYGIALSKSETTVLPTTATNSTGTSKTLTAEEFNPFGAIYYYTNTAVAANDLVGSSYLWEQYSAVDLRYGFNKGKTLISNRDVYIVAVPQANGMAKLHSAPIAQSLPTTADGLIYIHLGHAYSTYQIAMDAQHPIYQYKNGKLQLYTGA